MTRAVGILPECPGPSDANLDLSTLAASPPEILASFPQSEISRQIIIRKVIATEEQYTKDLDFIEEVFIRPLRDADPPIILGGVDEFIDEVFGNILELRECNRRLLEEIYFRKREQGGVIRGIGDIFLGAIVGFRSAYITYIGRLEAAEGRLKREVEDNGDLKVFLEQRPPKSGGVGKVDLKHWLNRPSEHLYQYCVDFEAIRLETVEGNPDINFLKEAVVATRDLQSIARLKRFQTAMGDGPMRRFDWHSLVPEDVRNGIPTQLAKHQAIIFEIILREMHYVKHLGNIEYLYIQPLRSMDPPIIPRERLEAFIQDVFHNFDELLAHHKRLLDQLFEIQLKEHPMIRSVATPISDAFLNSRDAYLKYIPNYPIAAYRIEHEMATNPQFMAFMDQRVRHPDAHRLDMKSFVQSPIPHLFRYELALQFLLKHTPSGHEDLEIIPPVLNVIRGIFKETEPRVVSTNRIVELWNYIPNLVFNAGEDFDMDLLNENRSLIHTGRVWRQFETGFESNGWTELFVFLFDNYLVMTTPKEKDGVTKYRVCQRPIPLDLLTLPTIFVDPPVQRGGRLLPFDNRREANDQTQNDNSPIEGATTHTVVNGRALYPCTIHHSGRFGGLFTLFAESLSWQEWKAKLEEAIWSRKVAQELNKVFEVKTLSVDTFLASTLLEKARTSRSNDGNFTGKVTCSVPFTTRDGRALVAIGCAEGVWIGFRNDSQSMRRVLHLRMVTQCAMLEDFGIFLVLADKFLFAWHIEALVPSLPKKAVDASQKPQKLSRSNDVQFFTVGNIGDRTVIIYMRKKKRDSVFRVLEPVVEKINEKTKAQHLIRSIFGLRFKPSEWFRVYRDFSLPCDSYDLVFLKASVLILCDKGFEIMDLSGPKSVTIPRVDDPRLKELGERTKSCRPMGMFTSGEEEFLLCWDEFGLYVDKDGDPSRMGTVEWEGKADRAVCHPPYILLFDPQFIEIRHVETGRLVQIISGNDVQCIWDGRGANQSQRAIYKGSSDEIVSQESVVHGVMNAEAAPPGGRDVTTQHVFELVPMVPLPLPGSPSFTPYFWQSGSSAYQAS